jgi:hypothetical protein
MIFPLPPVPRVVTLTVANMCTMLPAFDHVPDDVYANPDGGEAASVVRIGVHVPAPAMANLLAVTFLSVPLCEITR